MKKQSFIFGTILLAVSGIICKIIGAVYKIPLTNILGTQGVGIYYVIFPVYVFMLTFASNSFTIAISRKVSKCIADGKDFTAFKVFKSSLLLLSILGLLGGIVLASLSRLIATLQGVENAFICYIVISPSILLVAISCAFKGYFQGLQNMTSTALSQIVEQIAKLGLGFLLAGLLIKKGVVYGTIGALLGVTLSEVFEVLFFVLYYSVFRAKHKRYFKFFNIKEDEKLITVKSIVSEIFKSSIPLTLSSIILPLSMVIDSFLIINILKSLQFDKVFATKLLGLNSGVVNTLVGLPSTLSVAICMTIVPFITFALSKKDFAAISEKTALSIKLSIIISVPCIFAFAIFSPHIIRILYSHSFESNYEFNVASSLLCVSSINILYLAILQISTSLLQAINKSYIPVISLSVSLVLKVVFEVLLIRIPYINIAGAIVSNTVCYFISSAINIYFFKKYIPLKFSFYQTVICPVMSSICMVGVVLSSIIILGTFLSYLASILLSFLLGIVLYLGLIILFKAFNEQEQRALFNWKNRLKVNRS